MADFDEKRSLAEINHQNTLARQRESRLDRERLEARKEAARANAAAIAQTGNLDAMRLAHELDEETRERDFLDLVREENVRLQSLVQETKVAQIDRTHESQTQINQLTQEAIIDLVKKVLAKRLGVTEQDLDATKFAKMEQIKHQMALEFGISQEKEVANILKQLEKTSANQK